MNLNDFKFNMFDEGYEDYWFDVIGHTQEYLTNKYMEQSLLSIVAVLYSKKENRLYLEKVFPFNCSVILIEDDELKSIILDKIKQLENNK